MNAIDLKNRTAIVTGGARGIGFAVAKRMLVSGATVVLWDVDAAALDKAGAALQGQGSSGDGHVHAAVVDVTDAAAIARAVAADLRGRGKIDILVNNAGITGGNAPLWELAPEVWRRVVEVNLVAPYLTCRAVVPHMVRAGYGRIVNIASIAGKEGNPNASHYSASKAGLIALTKSLAKELAATGVLVNAVTPAAAPSLGPTADQSKVPDNFPDGVPLPYGGKVMAVQSLANNAHNVVFSTDSDTPDTFNLYKNTMSGNGWGNPTQEYQGKDQSFLSFKKGDTITNISVSKDPKTGKRIVAVMYYDEKPLPFPEF